MGVKGMSKNEIMPHQSVLTVQPINTQPNARTTAKPLTGSKKI